MQVLLSEPTNSLLVSGIHTLRVEVNAAHDYNKIHHLPAWWVDDPEVGTKE